MPEKDRPLGGDPCKALLGKDFSPYGAAITGAVSSSSAYTQACEYTLDYTEGVAGNAGAACACTRVEFDPVCNYPMTRELSKGSPRFQAITGLGDDAYFYDQGGPTYVVRTGQYELTITNQISCHPGTTTGCDPKTMDSRGVALALAKSIVSRL